jgi:hypothetical protein
VGLRPYRDFLDDIERNPEVATDAIGARYGLNPRASLLVALRYELFLRGIKRL